MTPAVLGNIERLVNDGLSLIPCGPDKRPLNLMSWKRWQTEKPDRSQIARWLREEPPCWAIVTGAISGIVVLDFDGEEGERLRQRLGLQPNVKTGRGGHHVWFDHPGWYVPTLNSKAQKELGARWSGVDIKGDGGYAITIGRSKFGDYRPLRLQVEFPDRLPLEFRRDVGLLDPPGGPTPELLLDRYLTQAVPGSRNNTGFDLAYQLRDNGVEQGEAERVLADYARRVPEDDHPYTEGEALASVKAAYGRLPREPWSSAPRLSPGSSGSGPVRASKTVPKSSPDENGTPKQPNRWPRRLDKAAYHGVAGAVVEAIEPHSESDPAAVLVQLLALFGNSVGRGPGFAAGTWRHNLNEFVTIVGPTSSGRKGMSERDARRPMELADETLRARIASGLSSAEGLIYRVRDASMKRRKARKGEVSEDGYVDEIEDEGVLDKRLVVIESELSTAFARMQRTGNALGEVLCQAWDGDSLSTLTKSPLVAANPHVTVIGHTTPANLHANLDEAARAGGLCNRFLWVCARRSKELPRPAEPAVDRDLTNALIDALQMSKRVGTVDFDNEAGELWDATYSELTRERDGMLDVVCARAEAHARRLAVIYTLLDRETTIRLEHLRAALAVWRYCEDSARYLFGGLTGQSTADVILTALRKRNNLTRNEIYDLFSRNHRRGEIEQALATLLVQGLARFEKQPTGGRPTERWYPTDQEAR